MFKAAHRRQQNWRAFSLEQVLEVILRWKQIQKHNMSLFFICVAVISNEDKEIVLCKE